MAVEKKIKYKDQRLTKAQQKKAKPANQGGGPNYLGKEKTVTVPKKWLSSPDHVVAELAYITPREQKILLDANLYGSLNGKPNRGPGGIMSLQGDMGSVGGESSGNNGGDGNTGRERGAERNRSQTTSKSTTNNKSSNDDGPRGPQELGTSTRTVDRITAPEAYEMIGGKSYDVTPDTIGDREKARIKQSILDAPIPNFTPKGIEYFKDGNLLNTFAPKKDQFNMFSLLGNAALFAINPALAAKYRQAKSLYSGAKYAKDLIQPYTTKNLNKPFEVIEGLTKNIGLKDKNVIQSFKDSLTNNVTSKTKPVINTNTDSGSNDGINTLENANALQDEYRTLLQKLQTGSISDAERTRYTMLKNMLGI